MVRIALTVIALCLSTAAQAQNTAGVFGPIIKEGHKLAEYRFSSGEPFDNLTPWAQRIFYEQSFNDRLMGRLEYQWRDQSEFTDAQFEFLRAMLWIDAGKLTENWHTGFRIDARVRDGGRPDDIALSWSNQFTLSEDTFARFVVMSLFNIGDGVDASPVIETRSSIFKRLDSGHSIGVELYDNLGQVNAFASFEKGRHEIAPVITWPVPGPYTLYTSVSFGLSDPVPDYGLRLRVGRQF
ncbi:hypothetical protein [Parvularcula lutaonensis]|uniref:Uncharacterized protein n=1 Tax=Parvularcula lutaonensis TaxID=491923 RepID=A0ABV7MBV5_9PROT|nr:hypothetical protein [Parvularcula lutaonensis]GGY39697.1 hypothetical protein GCM10007148_05040 [Parvularcula lutaonensis]